MKTIRADTKATNGLSGAADSWPRSAQDFALEIGVSERTIRRAIYRGDLLATKHAGVFRISRRDAESYLQHGDSPIATNGQTASARSPFGTDELVAALLPRQLTSMVGREEEISYLVSLLTDTCDDRIRLLTLTGTGGVGKTRLALQIAEHYALNHQNLVRFVSLATITRTRQVAPAIAQSLGVHVTRNDDLIERIATVLNRSPCMLVIDNFEQVAESAPVIVELLKACPDLTVLVTSRVSLHLSGEHEHSVLPLSFEVASGTGGNPVEEPPAAVRLFIERAQSSRADFEVDSHNVEAVSEICRRLGGLPLAIELAASRIKVLSPHALLAHLDHRLSILTGGGPDLPQRQRTIRNTIAWSYNLLTPGEQQLFRHLGVFVGGCTLEAATVIAGCPDGAGAELTAIATLDEYTSLVDKSMLHRVITERANLEPRYDMLETVREFAVEALVDQGEHRELRARHVHYMRDFVERTAPLLQWQQNTVESVQRLDVEYANISAALNWSLDTDPESLVRIAVAMQSYWWLRGRVIEGTAWLDQALALSVDASNSLRSSVLRSSGWMAWHACEFDRARELCEEGVKLARTTGEPLAIAHGLAGLGFIAQDQGDFEVSLACQEEMLEIGIREGLVVWEAWTTRNIGQLALAQGELKKAETWLLRALRLFNQIGHPYATAEVTNNLARLAFKRGQYGQAAELLHSHLSVMWNESGLCRGLEDTAELAVACDLHLPAARLFGAAEAHRKRLGTAFHPSFQRIRYYYDSMYKKAADPFTFDSSWSDGSGLTAQSAFNEMLHTLDLVRSVNTDRRSSAACGDGLTRREIEVLRLVAGKRSNKQIASTLYISIPTVKRHLTNIFNKLDAPNRDEAVELALARRLI